jgi:hypothetical protein
MIIDGFCNGSRTGGIIGLFGKYDSNPLQALNGLPLLGLSEYDGRKLILDGLSNSFSLINTFRTKLD